MEGLIKPVVQGFQCPNPPLHACIGFVFRCPVCPVGVWTLLSSQWCSDVSGLMPRANILVLMGTRDQLLEFDASIDVSESR